MTHHIPKGTLGGSKTTLAPTFTNVFSSPKWEPRKPLLGSRLHRARVRCGQTQRLQPKGRTARTCSVTLMTHRRDDFSTSFFGNSTTPMGLHRPPQKKGGRGGGVGAPHQCPLAVESKLPLPHYADVRLHIPMTHRNTRYTGLLFADEAVRVINEHSVKRPTQPMFMYLALHDTHSPLEAPWPYVAPYAAKWPVTSMTHPLWVFFWFVVDSRRNTDGVHRPPPPPPPPHSKGV